MVGCSRLATLAVGPLLGLWLGSGCAVQTPPSVEVSNARTMLERAEEQGAAELAPLPLLEARDKLDRAERCMERQEYEAARRLAEQSGVDAALAVVESGRARRQQAVRDLTRTLPVLRSEVAPPGS